MSRNILALAITAALVGAPTIAHSIELTDYDVPTSQWEEAYLTASGGTKSGNQDQTSYDLRLGLDYQNNYTSPMQNWGIWAIGDGDVNRGPNDGDSRESDYRADAGFVIDNYFRENNKLFWFGSADAGARKDADKMRVRVSAGVGYGRIVNATPLSDALRVVDALRGYGIVSGDLSKSAYLDLAQVIDRENEFKGTYGLEEYEAHWFQAMEAVLRQAGALTRDGLGADGTLHARRVLIDEPTFTRKHGWVVRAGVGYMIQDYDGQDNDPAIHGQFEYALPIGLTGQFLNTLNYYSIFADDTDHLLNNRMSYNLEVSGDLDWINSWEIEHVRRGSSSISDTTRNELYTGVEYHITNKITAGAGVTGVRRNDGGDWDVITGFTLAYRLR